ncbi:MAG: phosphate starvation-inducible protein PhoH [Actinomycetota bacterium]|nr:phosphate starvation-inducible protein PhoH [Actinomycetota bacterium]
MTGTTIVMLDPMTSTDARFAGEPWAGAVEPVDAYELPSIDLSEVGALLLGNMIDQEFLYRHRALVRSFLDDGKVIVFSGHLLRPWLPGCGAFVPKAIATFHDYALSVVNSHPLYAGVDPHDLTFRRGVAGFFARGHHPTPPGAEVLLALPGGEPVTYVDRVSTGGTILVHAGGALFDGTERDSTASRVPAQLLAWLRAEVDGR